MLDVFRTSLTHEFIVQSYQIVVVEGVGSGALSSIHPAAHCRGAGGGGR